MKNRNFLMKTVVLSVALSTMLIAAERVNNLSVDNITKNSAMILWDHDDNSSNGFVAYYTQLPFGATKIADSNFTNAVIVNSADTHEATLNNLDDNSTYGVKVSSCVGTSTEVTCLPSEEEVIFTTLESEKLKIEEAKANVWCVSHWSNLIEIENIPTDADGVNIYRKAKDTNESAQLILTKTENGEYLDPNDNLQPSYEAYEYIVKSFTDNNGTITESEGITIESD